MVFDAALKADTTHQEDFVLPYVNDLRNVVDIDAVRKAASPSRAVRFPVGFPLHLHLGLCSRHELQGVVFAGGGSVGLYREPVISWREIVKKRRRPAAHR